VELTGLAGRLTAALGPSGVTLRHWGGDVFNIITNDREMVRADVDTFRAALTECGYEEVKSWVAVEGMSWLSDGVFAGVSFRVRAAA
jgi:hypothetical protein